jgi:hypothetical protein
MILHFSKNGPIRIKVFQTWKTGNTATSIPRKISILQAANRTALEKPRVKILLY